MSNLSSNQHNQEKLSSARFSESTDAFVEEFTASIQFDKRLYAQDIQGSIAHAHMLREAGILEAQELADIEAGLAQIKQDIETGQVEWSIKQEDIHMNIEARLTDLIGITGKKLHTGRSRNDQVATDIRLYIRDEIDLILPEMTRLMTGIITLAEKEADTIMPGFTHLQVAQPITFGHHMMAWYEMIKRDAERLVDCRKRVNTLPLGSAALAGTTYPINRQITADILAFDRISENSLDGVSDRDFAIEFTSFAAIFMMHLSRFAEEMVLWSSAQFQFIDLPDRFCTGSSIMPQKKNPDVPELVRGKTGRVYGHLMSLLTLMKSQPLAYNKDNQEDKEPLFDTVDTVRGSLRAFADMIPAIIVLKENTYQAAKQGFATATDLADYLVREKNLAFRDSHEVVGLAVAEGIRTGKDLSEMSLETLQGFCDKITEDVYDILTLEGSVSARNHLGGTAPCQVKAAIERAKADLL